MMSEYPEHEKLAERREEHRAIQSFCWYLSSNGLLNRRHTYEDEAGDEQDVYWGLGDNDIAILISEYFGIDPKKFEEEKLKMLESIRESYDN